MRFARCRIDGTLEQAGWTARRTFMSEQAQSWKNAAYAGIAFGLTFGLVIAAIYGWVPPQTGGEAVALAATIVSSGLLFGLLIGLFMMSPIVPQAADIPLMPGETLEHSGFANHFLNMEGRGGRLGLTNTHLVFVPHAVNIQRGGVRIPRSEIAGVAPVRTLGIVPNGIAVTLRSGMVERFVVNGRATWLAKIGAP
jgi:hypothetical protein